jgi:hypothetical protein
MIQEALYIRCPDDNCYAEIIPDIHDTTPMQEQVEEMLDTLPPSVDIIKGEF